MSWNDVYTAPENQPPPPDTSSETRVGLPPVYAPSMGVNPGSDGSAQPPPQKGILDTSFKKVSTREDNSSEVWGRVGQAATEAFMNAPSLGTAPGNISLFTPQFQQDVNQETGATGWLGRNVVLPAGQLGGTILGGLAGAGAAIGQTGRELANAAKIPIPASLQRDLPFLGASVATVTGGTPFPEVPAGPRAAFDSQRYTPPLEPAGPRYAPPAPAGATAGGATAEDVQRVAAAQAQRGAGVGPTSPTGIQGPIAPPYVPPATTADAAAIRKQWYDVVDANPNAAVKPDYVNQGLDAAIKKLTPKGQLSADLGAGDPASKLVVTLSNARDKPLSLGDYTAADQKLTQMVDGQVKPDGSLSKTGQQIQNVQYDLRDHFNAAGPDDVVGGQEGFDALNPARKSFSQEQKMAAADDILRRAYTLTDNPQNAVRTLTRNYLNSDASRGLTDMERAAFEKGAERGWLGTAIRAGGSQFVAPVVGGLLGGAPGVLVGKGIGEASGGWAGAMARARMQGVLPQLGASVPAPPGLLGLPTGG